MWWVLVLCIYFFLLTHSSCPDKLLTHPLVDSLLFSSSEQYKPHPSKTPLHRFCNLITVLITPFFFSRISSEVKLFWPHPQFLGEKIKLHMGSFSNELFSLNVFNVLLAICLIGWPLFWILIQSFKEINAIPFTIHTS